MSVDWYARRSVGWSPPGPTNGAVPPPVLSRTLETLDTRVEGGDVALRGYKLLFLLFEGLQQHEQQ